MERHTEPENKQVYTRAQQMIISVLRLTAWIVSFIAFMHILRA